MASDSHWPLEYNIVLSIVIKTGRKLCCVREQIIGIVMASEHDLDWKKRDLRIELYLACIVRA